MGRQKHGSIVYQLNERLKSLQRFGQSKHSAKYEYRREQESKGEKWNPAYAKGIFFYKTYSAYKQTVMEMAAWIKKEHPEIKTLAGVKKEHAIKYLQYRQNDGKSAYTLSKDMSAINKIFCTGLTKKEAGLINRSYKNVTRSRGEKPNDKKYNPKNYTNQITFAKATGCRRESILGGQYQVKACSLWQDSKGNVFVSLIEKGGKFRNAPVLERYKADIKQIVPNVPIRTPHSSIALEEHIFKELYRNSAQEVLFDKYTEKIDNHAFRAEYARERYEELVQIKKEQGEEILQNYRGYDRDCLRQVSQDLGHNRLSVVVEHYMR